MFRCYHGLFKLTAARKYATNSRRHLELQAELGQQLETFREINYRIEMLRFYKQKYGSEIKESSPTFLNSTQKANNTSIQKFKNNYADDRERVMKNALKILDEIRNECVGTRQLAIIPTTGLRK